MLFKWFCLVFTLYFLGTIKIIKETRSVIRQTMSAEVKLIKRMPLFEIERWEISQILMSKRLIRCVLARAP
jgi:hypothetical protein